MKSILFLSLFLAAVNCHNSKATSDITNKESAVTNNISSAVSDVNKNETLTGKWYLQPVLASDTASGKLPWINFNLSNNTFNGFSGCNSISGSFILKNESLSFNEQVISTKMACPGYNEKIFMDNLLKTNRYQIKQGVLQLMYNTTILSNWARHADTSTTKQL